MDFIHKWSGVVAVVVIAIGSFVLFAPTQFGANATGPAHWQMENFLQGLQAGTGNQFSVSNTGQVTLGLNGSAVTQVQNGTCNLSTDASAFAATTTKQFYCTVTGVKANDLVMADLPVGAGANGSGAGSLGAGFEIVAAYATTSNQIGVTIANFTGAATSSYPQATTTVEYRNIR